MVFRSFKEQSMCSLCPIWVRLGWTRTGKGSLNHDVQWDRSRALGRVIGWARGVEEHGDGLGQCVGVGVLMMKMVRVNVGWQRRGRGRRRQLKAKRKVVTVLH